MRSSHSHFCTAALAPGRPCQSRSANGIYRGNLVSDLTPTQRCGFTLVGGFYPTGGCYRYPGRRVTKRPPRASVWHEIEPGPRACTQSTSGVVMSAGTRRRRARQKASESPHRRAFNNVPPAASSRSRARPGGATRRRAPWEAGIVGRRALSMTRRCPSGTARSTPSPSRRCESPVTGTELRT
jgi:hypothetical protein